MVNNLFTLAYEQLEKEQKKGYFKHYKLTDVIDRAEDIRKKLDDIEAEKERKIVKNWRLKHLCNAKSRKNVV